MPGLSGTSGELIAWLTTHGIVIALVAIALLFAYRWARPAIHRVLVRVMEAQARTLGEDPAHAAEVDTGSAAPSGSPGRCSGRRG